MTQQELLRQAVGIASSIGHELSTNAPKSDDPFLGYDYKDLTYLVGQEAVDKFCVQWTKDALKALEGQDLAIGQPVVATRGKMKGVKGWINAEMPSQYNAGDLAYLVITLSGFSGWVAKKSLKLRVPEIGERDKQAECKEKGMKVKQWSRGTRVTDGERYGHLVGYGKADDDSPVPTVAVQWEGSSKEEWVVASLLGEG
tara:strand:+ start:3333 stop:3929 length:597 start_codon:yes stop_codon:yes gene_type:complete